MTHKWLTKENVENAPTEHNPSGIGWSSALRRGFIADWLEMRKLLRCVVFGDTFMDLRLVLNDICDMLEATADES